MHHTGGLLSFERILYRAESNLPRCYPCIAVCVRFSGVGLERSDRFGSRISGVGDGSMGLRNVFGVAGRSTLRRDPFISAQRKAHSGGRTVGVLEKISRVYSGGTAFRGWHRVYLRKVSVFVRAQL